MKLYQSASQGSLAAGSTVFGSVQTGLGTLTGRLGIAFMVSVWETGSGGGSACLVGEITSFDGASAGSVSWVVHNVGGAASNSFVVNILAVNDGGQAVGI